MHSQPLGLFLAIQHAKHPFSQRLQLIFTWIHGDRRDPLNVLAKPLTSRPEWAIPPVSSTASTRPSSTAAIAPVSLAT